MQRKFQSPGNLTVTEREWKMERHREGGNLKNKITVNVVEMALYLK